MARFAWLGALAVFLALALYQLYPAWWDLESGVVGDWHHPDTISNHWLYRWVAERLAAGEGLLHNDRYYVPLGDAPWLAGNGSDAVPYALLAALLPWPASLTVWVILALTLNGLSGYTLARVTGASAPAALVAGAALGVSPYVAAELGGGRFAQMPLYQVAFFLAAWHRLLERAPTTGRVWPGRATALAALGAAALYALAAFSYWYHGLWAALLGVLWFALLPRWRALVPFVPAALALTGPLLAIFLVNWSSIPGAGESTYPHPITLQASLPPWFPLQGRSGFWGPVILPAALLLPALVALLPKRLFGGLDVPAAGRAHAAALVAALAFWALCLGPYPSWEGGAESGVPGPFYALYGAAAPLRRFWWPYRHVVGLTVALLPLAALGLDRLFALLVRFAEPGVRRFVPLGAALVLVVTLPQDLAARGGLVAAPASRWVAPEVYTRLAALPGDALLELPITPARVTGQQTLSYQWLHHKKLLNGHAMWVARVRPAGWDEQIAAIPLLVALQAVEAGEAVSVTADPASLDALAKLGVRHFVVNEEYFPGALEPLGNTHRTVLTGLFGAPVLDDDGVAAWDLTTPTGATVEVPAADLPDGEIAEEGRVPEYGPLRPLAWSTLTRDLPPRALGEDER